MSTDDTPPQPVEQQLEIAGEHIRKALQDVLQAKLCVTLVEQYSPTSECFARTNSEKKRVAGILTSEVETELVKALSILNLATSALPSATLKKSE